ncbi:UDP-glucose 4-epimerase GalE [bacterium]|nr:UDP-glucose 4-epimerase GalE [bacterium]
MSGKTLLITGGAGYLGRCTMDWLLRAGFTPICVDNYSTGHRFEAPGIRTFEADLASATEVDALFEKLPPIQGIFHFAALALVEESHREPARYSHNNLQSTINTAAKAAALRVPFVHSSSCSVYGVPRTLPVTEESALGPISPYGETKRGAEEILREFSSSQGLRVLNLRYFNPAGWIEGADHGERHDPETHLIPNVVRAAVRNRTFSIFGNQYPTTDGTCVRDFLHVEDLADGHLKAFEYLEAQSPGFFDCINLGSGTGHSVLQAAETCERLLGKKFPIQIQPPRPGDPPALVASIEKARRVLNWAPQRSFEEILRSQITWEKRD